MSDRLTTGKTGAATITLKDGTVLTMGPDTTMDLSQFAFDSTTQEGNLLLDLLQGSVRVVTGLLGKVNPELFKVKTPTSVVGVRGHRFHRPDRSGPMNTASPCDTTRPESTPPCPPLPASLPVRPAWP